MFKFKFIDQQTQNTNNPPVSVLPRNTHALHEEESALENKNITTLIITDAAEQDIIGGVSLVKKELNHLQEDIRGLIPAGTACRDYVWECSTICFTCPPNLAFERSFSEQFARHFYHNLYEGLVEFGQQAGVGFVIVKLTAEAYPPTKDLGLWPYIIQFLPKDVPDDFFYGILPLRGCFYEKYQKTWESLEKG